MKWFTKSEDEQYSKVKLIQNKFYFEDDSKPSKIHIPATTYAEVKLNGALVSGEVTFHHTDILTITYLKNVVTDPSCTYKITVKEDKEASIHKEIIKGQAYQFETIKDFELNPTLKVALLELSPTPTPYDDILSMLREKKLNGLLLEENILKVANSDGNIVLPVVTSKEAKPGMPARFELIGGLKDGQQIQSEQFFAEYVDETPGEPGCDVYGNPVHPEDLFFFPEFGENVMVEDRGLMSLKAGRLVFTRHLVNVIEQQSVQKSYNWEDGLIEYDGDLVIDGDIKEGGQLKCTGNLTVLGGIFESYVFADGNIVVNGNTDQSVIYSGFSKIAAKQVENYSLQFLEIFERVMFETSFYADDGYNFEEKRKSLELAKGEFAAIQQSIDPFLSLVQQFGNSEIQEMYAKLSVICEEGIRITLNEQCTADEIKTEMEKFYAIIEESKDKLRDDLGSLTTNSANSSHLFAYTDINVQGPGTFQTIISAKESVKISGNALSTTITTDQFVEVGEFKPGNQTESVIEVKKNSGSIKVTLLHSDSVLKLGSKTYTALDDEEDIYYEQATFPKNKD
ncbi:FapA family protein [Priestia aryabhattai]